MPTASNKPLHRLTLVQRYPDWTAPLWYDNTRTAAAGETYAITWTSNETSATATPWWASSGNASADSTGTVQAQWPNAANPYWEAASALVQAQYTAGARFTPLGQWFDAVKDDPAWGDWIARGDDTVFHRWAAIQHETAEQRAERERQELERRAQWERERVEREARLAAQRIEQEKANVRAEKILRECLSPQQLDELARSGHFHLDTIAQNGQRRRYRIKRGRHGNVSEVDQHGHEIRVLCVHPTVECPDADTMLAQKLWLETAEPELLRVANVRNVRRGA